MESLQFDESTRVFEISVRELVEDDDVFHRVGFERSQAWRRLALGGEAHRRTLARRQEALPGYRGEVHLCASFETPDFIARVTGRADGALETSAGVWLIEEYKSCSFSPEGRPVFPPELEQRAHRQIGAYCALWEALGKPWPRAALILIDPTGEREECREIAIPPDDARADFLRRLAAKFRRVRAETPERRAKTAAALTLRFPHTQIRPIQEKLMQAVCLAVSQGGHLLAQAPTGSGKTAAVVFAALREALARGRKLIYLTSKNLQQDLVVETLRATGGAGFRAVRMRAKERMCANDRILCHEDHCRFARDYPIKMARSRLLPRLRETYSVLDPDTLFAEARAEEVCPFEVELEVASRADVFVGDYNYVFEPIAALQAFAPERLGQAILVIDEAHNLPERVRRIYSPAIRESDVAALENLAALTPGDVFRRMGEALAYLRDLLQRHGEELSDGESIGETAVSGEAYEDFLAQWDPAILSYFEWKRENQDFSEDDPVLALHFALVRFGVVRRFAESKPDFAGVVERGPGGVALSLVCLDPSRAIAPIVNAASSTILLSATLEPFDASRRLTGLDPDRTASIALPPPFPRENRRVMIIPSVKTTYSARERHYGRIAEILAELADAHAGNDLALFPSYRFLREVASRLPPLRAAVIQQREAAPEEERQGLLRALASRPAGGLLFLAVSGGMFAEGVDYPGDRLSGVFVVSPSLPQVTFERELLRRYHDDCGEPGFEYAYILPGMTRVVQAAGRLIRSETDRGVIALICRRFLEEPYVRYLPPDWYESDPSELSERDPAERVREFFAVEVPR
jgi:DNA excision repair protein ERCC-2